MEVRIASRRDGALGTMQALHRSALPHDVTPNLTRMLYSRIVDLMTDPAHGVLAVAEENGVLVGFCGVVYDPHDFSHQIGRERLELAKSLAKFAVMKPELLVDLGATVLGRERCSEPLGPHPEIFSMAVDSGHRSNGVGGSLIRRCVEELKSANQHGLIAKTASPGARQFYQRQGFRAVGEQDRLLRRLTILVRNF